MHKNIIRFISIACLFASNGLYSSFAVAESKTEYRLERMWPRFELLSFSLNNPDAIAIAPDGKIYIADSDIETDSSRILQLNAQGDFIRSWGTGDRSGVDDIAIAPDGSVYVTDVEMTSNTYVTNIQQFSAEGVFIRKWKGDEQEPDEQEPDSYETSIAIAPDGSVNVVTNDRIQKFSGQGDLIREWMYRDANGHQFLNNPLGIAITAEGNMYVIDIILEEIPESSSQKVRHHILQFNAHGDLIQEWPEDVQQGLDIAIAPDGSVYLTELTNRSIRQFSAEGDFIRQWGNPVGDILEPSDIATAPDGSVYVSDEWNNHIQQFSAQGDFIRQWGSEGTDDGQLLYPRSIAIALDGSVYVADSEIQQFSAEGDFIQTLGGYSLGKKQFDYPSAITITPDGSLFIVNNYNRIQKLIPEKKGITAHPYKAIILARGDETRANKLTASWKRMTQKAYQALMNQSFNPQEEIKFLTQDSTQFDLNGDGQFDDLEVASKESLRQAITQWATDAEDVVIFLADPEGSVSGGFQLNSNEILTGDELNVWVTELEQLIPGKVTIVIESPGSAGLFKQLASPDRYLFASAKADQPAVIANGGINSFAYYFWSQVEIGQSLKSAFEIAQRV